MSKEEEDRKKLLALIDKMTPEGRETLMRLLGQLLATHADNPDNWGPDLGSTPFEQSLERALVQAKALAAGDDTGFTYSRGEND